MEANAILTIYAALVLLGLPVMSAIDARRGWLDEKQLEFRRAVYGSVAFSLLVLGGLTLGVATWQDVDPEAVGWRVSDAREGFLWGAGITVAGLAVAWLLTIGLRAAGVREGPLSRLLMPRDAKETRAFLILSGVAAISEEYVYRGFLLGIGATWLGSPWLGAALVSASFAFAHVAQGFPGMVRAGALGFTLCIPVIQTGSLFPAVVAHFWINAAIGLGGWRVLLLPDETPASTPVDGDVDEVGRTRDGEKSADGSNDDSDQEPDREADKQG